jgi:hypothetical protein
MMDNLVFGFGVSLGEVEGMPFSRINYWHERALARRNAEKGGKS